MTADTPETSSKASREIRTSAVPERRVEKGKQPTVRVGLLERYEHVDFRVHGKFSLFSLEGDTIYEGIETGLLWRCKVDSAKPARFVYSVLTKTFGNEDEAKKYAQQLRADGHPSRLLPIGREVQINGNVIHEGRRWQVIVGAFEEENEAARLLELLNNPDEVFRPHILRHRVEDPEGEIELYDAEYDRSAMVKQGFRVVPDSHETKITIYGIRIGIGFHWEHLENRVYRGVIEVQVDNTGNLLALNELLLDDYLKGVIPSEMHSTFPPDALKAQAVAARSYTVSRLANRPPNDPIDFPATVMFQVYSGINEEDEATTRAVAETAGEVLKIGKEVCETFFSSNSGGHTESKEYWTPPGETYLVGKPIFDKKEAKRFKMDLTKEVDIAKWVHSHPDSYSNPRGTGIEVLDKNTRYFRWEVTYNRKDLEEIIQRKLGIDIGTLIDLQPLRRGVSGRITEMEILGSLCNHKVRGELNIRRVLSENTLNSSCFVVELVMGELDTPVEITLIGAGFGHGVGMDQTAAGVMAHNGMDYKQILYNFYEGARLTKIW